MDLPQPTPRRWSTGLAGRLCGCVLALAGVRPEACAVESPRPAAERRVHSRSTHWPLRALDVDGNVHRLGESPATIAWAFVFLSPRCERSAVFLPVIDRLMGAYEDHHVEFFIVVADPDVDRAETRAWRERDQIRIPILFDGGSVLSAEFGATHTPQAIVMDSAGRRVYCGKIDDRPDRPNDRRARPRQTHLATALRSLTAGRAPMIRKTDPVGRPIDRRPLAEQSASVNWSRHIAPLMIAHCSECHHADGLSPFPLSTLAEVRPHAHAIVPLLRNHTMPPWKPTHGFGDFRNDRRMSPTEIDLFAAWVEAGTPAGNEEDLPRPSDYGTGWLLGEPDLVFQAESVELTTDKGTATRSFVWPTRLETDRLVSALEFRPGKTGGVSQASVQVDISGAARKLDLDDPQPGYDPSAHPPISPAGSLGGWAPFTLPSRLPAGWGRLLPRGADIVLQVSYHSNAALACDRPQIGVYLAPESARRLVGDLVVADLKLRIPAGASRHRHRARYELPTPATVIGVTPHLGGLAREATVVAVLPDGSTDRLLRIDDWDPGWHDHYMLRRPLRLPAGTRIEFEAVFDNSSKNPRQASEPPATVRWGEGPGQEVAVCFLQVSSDSLDDFATLMEHNTNVLAAQNPAQAPPERTLRDPMVRQAGGLAPVPAEPEKRPVSGFEKALRIFQWRPK